MFANSLRQLILLLIDHNTFSDMVGRQDWAASESRGKIREK